MQVVSAGDSTASRPTHGASHTALSGPFASSYGSGAVLVIHGSAAPPSVEDVRTMHDGNVPPLPAFLVTNGNTRFVPVWDDGLKEATDIRWVD